MKALLMTSDPWNIELVLHAVKHRLAALTEKEKA